MKALVLAGGFGTRLKEAIHGRPKVMAPVNGRPFLEYVLEILRKNGIEEVVISIGYLGDYIRNHFGNGKEFGLKIEYSEEDFPLGTAGAIKKAEGFFKETFLVLNGDTYLDTNINKIIEFHEKRKGVGTIALVRRDSTLETGLVKRDKRGRINDFLEKPDKDQAGWVNAGLYVLEPRLFKLIKKGKKASIEREIFPLLAKKGILHGMTVSEDFIDLGTFRRYRLVKKFLAKKKRRKILSQAPVRVSFVGGSTDLPDYFLKEGGQVISGTIDLFARVDLQTSEAPSIRIILPDYQREQTFPLGKSLPYDGDIFDLYKAAINHFRINRGLEISVRGDFPAGSGLGSSSAVAVALIGAILRLKKERITKEKTARLAIELEREILKIPGGWQDQYASAYGGINFIKFLPQGKVEVLPIGLGERRVKDLERSLKIFYLSAKRSEKIQQQHLVGEIKKKGKTKKALRDLKKLAVEARGILEKGQMAEFGGLLHQAWEMKKKSSSRIATGLINEMYTLAKKKGAWGGKLLGAGGGGCLLISALPKYQPAIRKELERKGARLVDFAFEFEGLKVEER